MTDQHAAIETKSTATNDSKNDVFILSDLLQTCRQSENDYRQARDRAKDMDLKALFAEYAQQRAAFAQELMDTITRLGGTLLTSAAPDTARGWTGSGAARRDILSDCERNEHLAVDTYEDALEKQPSDESLSLVQTQYLALRFAHDRIKQLSAAL